MFSLISSFNFFLFHASLSNKLAFFRLSFHWLTLRFSLGIYNLPVVTSFFPLTSPNLSFFGFNIQLLATFFPFASSTQASLFSIFANESISECYVLNFVHSQLLLLLSFPSTPHLTQSWSSFHLQSSSFSFSLLSNAKFSQQMGKCIYQQLQFFAVQASRSRTRQAAQISTTSKTEPDWLSQFKHY